MLGIPEMIGEYTVNIGIDSKSVCTRCVPGDMTGYTGQKRTVQRVYRQ